MASDEVDKLSDKLFKLRVSKKILLILDINKTLVLRINGKIHKRKGLTKFIDSILEIYDVAVFTSMTKKNLDLLLPKIFTPEQISKLIFIWDREYTDPDPDRKEGEWSTIKNIDKIKNLYKYERYLLIDDSYDKVRFNQPDEILICPAFEDINESGLTLNDLITKIKMKLSNN